MENILCCDRAALGPTLPEVSGDESVEWEPAWTKEVGMSVVEGTAV